MKGKIIKGIAGFYYVHVEQRGIYECKAKGIFRNRKVKPLVGDDVLLDSLDEAGKKGNITDILLRRNELIRPASANVDQAMIIFAAAQPAPNLGLLDRFLLMMEKQQVKTVICFNKRELVSSAELQKLCDIYRGSGCRVVTASVRQNEGLETVREILDGKTTVMAGPSGVGKSSMTNALYPDAEMATGDVSEKIKRGRHTTRHSELFSIGHETYLMDTPGFSTLYLEGWEKEELKYYYPEFETYFDHCRFNGCNHINEPDCAVKQAVEEQEISRERYVNYKMFYEELAGQRRY
ncbi:MAG: ribosome small subunit-dependent GTPase A [Coprococcus sp.]